MRSMSYGVQWLALYWVMKRCRSALGERHGVEGFSFLMVSEEGQGEKRDLSIPYVYQPCV